VKRTSRIARQLLPPALALSAVALLAAGCSSTDSTSKLTRELLSMPKEEAYAKGDALAARKKWELARQYLRFVAENYANDPLGKQAALRLADSFFEEKTPLGYLEAQARYKDFRNRYPSHPRSDYALFRLAQTADRQAEKPDRDQTNTRVASASYRELIQTYPDSPYSAEARARLRVMRDLLAGHELLVGQFYFKRRAFKAAKSRLDGIIAGFPEFEGREKVLYLAGETERRLGHEEDAWALWDRLREDFPKSSFLRKIPQARPAEVPGAVAATPGV
jgi:outer membrane protein assembly factor BamD